MPPHVFLLRPHELRYGAFAAGPDGLAAQAVGVAPLDPAIWGSGPLGGPARDVEALREAIAVALGQATDVPKQASLVLPDAWMRLTFAEADELPSGRQDRLDVLRWKLKRLVPFRVEDLRLSATEVTPFPAQEEPRRLLLGFAVETLVSQLESVFEQAGVELGMITNLSLSLASALEAVMVPEALGGLVMVDESAYVIAFHRLGEPLLYRYKSVGASGLSADAVRRDLRLTASFVDQHFADAPRGRVVLAAPAEAEPAWQGWIERELAAEVAILRDEHLPLVRTPTGVGWLDVAPMVGAVRLEVD